LPTRGSSALVARIAIWRPCTRERRGMPVALSPNNHLPGAITMSSKTDSTLDTLAADSLNDVNGGARPNYRGFVNNRFSNVSNQFWARRSQFWNWERAHGWPRFWR
jgi:hypothetical protein